MNIREWFGKKKFLMKYKKAISPQSIEDRFTNIFKEKIWYNNGESFSGSGSTLENTSILRGELQQYFDSFKTPKTIVDVGCGDFNWMQKVDFSIHQYIGIDIVKNLIDRNNEKYANNQITFKHINAVAQAIPSADIVICKDVIFHLSLKDGLSLIDNVKQSGATAFLTTTTPSVTENTDIRSGEFRSINVLLSPYNFPKSTMYMDYSESRKETLLGVWNIADLK